MWKQIQFDSVVATSTLREVAIEFSEVFISVVDKEFQLYCCVFASKCAVLYLCDAILFTALPFIE